jgi:hypothetical protein
MRSLSTSDIIVVFLGIRIVHCQCLGHFLGSHRHQGIAQVMQHTGQHRGHLAAVPLDGGLILRALDLISKALEQMTGCATS